MTEGLSVFFGEHPKAALAFSGGADSAYLLYCAASCGASVRAYYVNTAFQPEFELRDARRLCDELGVPLTVLTPELLSDEELCSNPSDRCCLCKRKIFSAIIAAASRDGCGPVIDGTNASDVAEDRPGMRALRELGVRSPLRECGITKHEIRRLSKEAGLFTWDKPAYSCLATRIASGEHITAAKLARIEEGETALERLGFRDFRLRCTENAARLQLRPEQLALAMERRTDILAALGGLYDTVSLDLNTREGERI